MTENPKWTHEQVNRLLDDIFFDYPVMSDEEIDAIMKCPNCKVYEVHPDSLAGWCYKCTGVLTDQKLEPMCMACGKKKADERSEHGFCYKCHFDLTYEVLDQPSGSREDNERLLSGDTEMSDTEKDFARWTFDPPEQAFKTSYALSGEMQSLVKEYKEHHQKRTAMEKAHPNPSGGEEYDFLVLRDDTDYRWAMQRLTEIEERMGWLVLKQITGISR